MAARNLAPRILALSLGLALLAGCTGPGGTVQVVGSPADVVTIQRNNIIAPSACATRCLRQDGCVDLAFISLDEDGVGSRSRMIDDMSYYGSSPISGCFGTTYVPCGGTGTIYCSGGLFNGFGTIAIAGSGGGCKSVLLDPHDPDSKTLICNDGIVSLSIDTENISIDTPHGTTPALVAQQVADAINLHPTLGTKVHASATNGTVSVYSISTGVQYAYPWKASCSYDPAYFTSCPYQANLSPVATMGSRPPL